MVNNSASLQFLTKTTLKRKLEKYKSTQKKVTHKKLGKYEVFTKTQEAELSSHVKQVESSLYGLTTKDLQMLAYDLAELNNIKHNFGTTKKIPGRIWLQKSVAWILEYANLNCFFDLLTHTTEIYRLTLDKIFNLDETGITTVPKRMPKLIGTKGKNKLAY